MSISLFSDKNIPPSPDEISLSLGNLQPVWIDLIKFIEENYQMESNLSYGGKNYGWNLWYRKGGKSLASLYPQKDGFVVQVVLGKTQVEAALQLSLGEHVRKILRETPQLHDGRWLFIPVHSQGEADDVKQLFLTKKKLVRPGYRGVRSPGIHPSTQEEEQ